MSLTHTSPLAPLKLSEWQYILVLLKQVVFEKKKNILGPIHDAIPLKNNPAVFKNLTCSLIGDRSDMSKH